MASDLHHEPWNKGIIVGQKAPLKLKKFGRFVCAFSWLDANVNWRYSISAWTANFAPVTWFD